MNKAFSLIELLVVMGMMTVLVSIGGLSLAAVRTGSQLDLIASEVRSELLRVQAEIGNGNPSGVYFEGNRFVYFEGDTYTEGAATNEETILPTSMTFSSIDIPNSIVKFDNVTGNPINYVYPYQVVLSGSGGEEYIVSVNEWGVVEIN
jgi:prepilin-type N-terminal cleavage/methylation domain-containing protein